MLHNPLSATNCRSTVSGLVIKRLGRDCRPPLHPAPLHFLRFYTLGYGTTFPIDTITETFCDNYLTKIIPTSSSLEGCIAVAICSFPNQESFLASAALGDEAWSSVFEFNRFDEFGMIDEEAAVEFIEDVVYHERDGMLYALSYCATVMIFKPYNDSSWVIHYIMAARESIREMGYWRRYIILSRGEILQITRYMKEDDDGESSGGEEDDDGESIGGEEDDVGESSRGEEDDDRESSGGEEDDDGESSGGGNCQLKSNAFQILKFDQVVHDRHMHEVFLCPDESCWVRVDSLEDQSLFLGYNHSFMNCGDDKIGPQRNKI